MEKEINYAGKRLKLLREFNENNDKHWDDFAQEVIDIERSKGKSACCIHEGELHGLYVEKEKKIAQCRYCVNSSNEGEGVWLDDDLWICSPCVKKTEGVD